MYEKLAQNESERTNRARSSVSKTNLDLPEAFRNIELLGNTNKENIENIYSEGNEKVHTTINLNKDTNTYSLFEVNANSGEVIILVNNEEYTVINEGENLNMYTKDGEVLPILITEYEDKPEITPSLENIQAKETGEVFSARATSFGKEYGPYKKTNKVWIEVLEVISLATGGIGLKFKHPVLGIISVATAGIAYVGDKKTVTLYIKYWQSYATNDPTYIRQRENYYQYNNYTGFVKSRTWYFYNSRPY